MSRINTPFTSEHFVAFLKTMVGRPYWYGTCVYRCTSSLLSGKSVQYPTSYKSSRQGRYNQDIANKEVCADCGGLGKGYAWTNGGEGVIESIGTGSDFKNVYESHGCPDYGTDTMFNYAKQQGMEYGTIDTLPELPGLFLWKSGHVGYYIGNGKLIEAKGFDYGIVLSNVSDRNFAHWYKAPWINYSAASGSAVVPYPSIKRGATGEYVKILQGFLVSLGYKLWKTDPTNNGIDGKFGSITDTAVRAFQSKEGLKVDGIVGSATWGVLLKDEPTTPVPLYAVTIYDRTAAERDSLIEQYDRVTFEQQN